YEDMRSGADKREAMRREYEAHAQEQERIAIEREAALKVAIAQAHSEQAAREAERAADYAAHDWSRPNPKYDTSIPDDGDHGQGSECVPPSAAPPVAKAPAKAPNRAVEPREVEALALALQNAIVCSGIDPGARDVMMCLTPIVRRELARGVEASEIEIEATLKIQDAACADICDERGRWGWMIRAIS